MQINNFHCIFNMPDALKTTIREGKEVSQGLPPYAVQTAYAVDEYDCPTDWMRGSGIAGSYFVGVEAGKGMWLDFNANGNHTHHVAILISIQGVNPLDGQSLVEIDQRVSLKQYKMKCPLHDIDFKQDRFCEKCGYKWVPQNYLSTTGTPYGSLWLDGVFAEGGIVRQYYFTEEQEKGFAHQVIGSEKKVYSIGVAFYLSKEPKPVPKYVKHKLSGLDGVFVNSSYHPMVPKTGPLKRYVPYASLIMRKSAVFNDVEYGHYSAERLVGQNCDVDHDFSDGDVECSMSLDIAVGAKIGQKIYEDPESLEFWQDKPAGLLYINYCPKEKLASILERGKKDLTKNGEGFLAGMKVGN